MSKRRGGERWADKDQYCVVCGKHFMSSRYNAKCCSSGCRVKLHRANQRQDKIATKVHDLIAELSNTTRDNNQLTGYAAAGLRLSIKQMQGLLDHCEYQMVLFEKD